MSKISMLPMEVRVAEGDLIRTLIKQKKTTDTRYTQAYVASLIDRDQTIFPQWLSGKTPIPDATFVALSEILDFNPLETRPYLTAVQKRLNDLAATNSINESIVTYNASCVPVLNNDQAIGFKRSRALPSNYPTMPELCKNTAHAAFGLLEESEQFEPAVMPGSIYYIIPVSAIKLSAIKQTLVACIIDDHMIVGTVKAMALGKVVLRMLDKTEVPLPNGARDIIGLVTNIETPPSLLKNLYSK